MLTIATASISVLLLSVTVVQSIYVFRYQNILTSARDDASKQKSDRSADNINGPVAIVLCLRGIDPSLSECLTGIISQQYPNFQIHIVFDHHNDSAVQFVDNFFEDQSVRPVLHFNSSPPKTCSLKCSGLITAIESLPDEIQYIALIDADTVADNKWLDDLLAPFCDSSVGATTGNRWFTPHESNIGTVVRKIWNSAAVPQMALYNIGWGGSLAFRRDVIQRAGFLESWRSAFCEDTMVADSLKPLGLKLQRVPSLITENTESTSLTDTFGWIVRQTLTVRLHNRAWPLVLGHGILTAIACYLPPFLIAAAWIAGERFNALTITLFCLLYQLANIGLLAVIDRCNTNTLNQRTGESQREPDASGFGMNLIATVLNQFLFPLAVFKAWTMRSVRWRGIDYKIKAGNELKMQSFVPYQELSSQQETAPAESIQ